MVYTYQDKEGPKLVRSAKIPLPSGLNTHHFDEVGCAATTEGTGWVLSGNAQALGDVAVGEFAIWATLDAKLPCLQGCFAGS